MDRLQSLVEKKWTARAESYGRMINHELASWKRRAWLAEIEGWVGRTDRTMEALDVGCGPGFFAIILSQTGWRATGVDCAEEMVLAARENAGRHGAAAGFKVMRADWLSFPDDYFDLVLSRNVAWSLTDPEAAYREWRRVLRPGGRLLIFDANWYRHLFDEAARKDKEEAERAARALFYYEHFEEPDPELAGELYSSLPMGRHVRPEYDVELLTSLGYTGVRTDRGLSARILGARELALYAGTPMFVVAAEA